MQVVSTNPNLTRFSDWPLALRSILGFWIVYYVTVVIRAYLSADPGTIMLNRLVTVIIGIVLTLAVYALIASTRDRPARTRVITAAIASFLAAVTQAGILISIDRYLEKPQDEMRFVSREGYAIHEQGMEMRISRPGQDDVVVTWPRIAELEPHHRFRMAADSAVTWFFFFAAWSAFYLAMQAQAMALGAQRRAAEAESAAKAAQVRALRYQVNPHFLFNTLNSLSSLIMGGRSTEAESMILKLSTFFRSSLSLDPCADVTLAEEIALQRLYLDIEQVRFPKRLNVEIEVPEDLQTARLPALILQPIVENAIKYGVSPTREKVALRIAAREAGPGRFVLEVTNTGKAAPKRKKEIEHGTGVGLANVCQRLSTRFGPSAQCEFGPLADGGYRVAMTLPLDRTDG